MKELTIYQCPNCGADDKPFRYGTQCCFCDFHLPSALIKDTGEDVVLAKGLEDAKKLCLELNFEKADKAFEWLKERYPDNSDIFYNAFLCSQKIDFQVDTKNNKRIPTLNNISNFKLDSHPDYAQAWKLADEEKRKEYESEVAFLEKLRCDYIAIKEKQRPVDIFISFKDQGKDREIAEKIYESLLDSSRGLKNKECKEDLEIFFSPFSLKEHIGENYEPYIYNAIETSKVMLVVSLDGKGASTPWVKNEWGRYLRKVDLGYKSSNSLIVLSDSKSKPSLPEALAARQYVDYGETNHYFQIKGLIKDILIGGGSFNGYTRPDQSGSKTRLHFEQSPLEHRPLKAFVPVKSKRDSKESFTKVGQGVHTSDCDYAINLLEKGNYKKALQSFEKVKDRDSNDYNAVKGVVLSKLEYCHFNNLDAFKFDRKALDLPVATLSSLISLAEKEEREIFISKMLEALHNGVSDGDFDFALHFGSVLFEFKDESIYNAAKETIKHIAGMDDSSPSSRSFKNDVLLYLEKYDIDSFDDILSKCIEACISSSSWNNASYYLEKLSSIYGGEKNDAYYFYSFLLEKNCGDFEKYLGKNPVIKDINELIQSIQKSRYTSRILELIIVALIIPNATGDRTSNEWEALCEWYKLFLEYIDEKEKSPLERKLLNHLISNFAKGSSGLFKLVIGNLKNNSQIGKHILSYANNALKARDFEIASEFFGYAVEYPSCSRESLYNLILSETGSTNDEELKANIHKLKDLEAIKGFYESFSKTTADIRTKNLLIFAKENIFDRKPKENDEDMTHVVCEIITHYGAYIARTKGDDKTLIDETTAIYEGYLKMGLFNECQAIARCLNRVGSSAKAYWTILLARLHSKTLEEALEQDLEPTKLNEWGEGRRAAFESKEDFYVDRFDKLADWKPKEKSNKRENKNDKSPNDAKRKNADKPSDRGNKLKTPLIIGGSICGLAILALVIFLIPKIIPGGGGLSYIGVSDGYGVKANNNLKDSSIEIPSNYKGKEVVEVLESGFAGNTILEDCVLPDTIKRIETGAFEGCSGLKTLEFSISNYGISTLDNKLTYIGDYAFRDCESLRKIYIPSTVEYIGIDTFKGCSNLMIYCEDDTKHENWPDSFWGEATITWGYNINGN